MQQGERETSVYRGFTDPYRFSRELSECEGYWNEFELKPGTFDQLLTQQLHLAIEQGRTTVNVLDLGSGSGALIKNVVNDRSDEEKQRIASSRRILGGNPNLRVRIVGLTDARSGDEFLKREPILPASYSLPIPTNDQISAENIYYSITRTQTLENFLSAVNLEQVDLLVSTAFFIYLEDIDVYKRTLLDAVQSLRSGGGKLLVSDYVSKTTPKIFDDNYYNEIVDKIVDADDQREATVSALLELMVEGSILTKKRVALLKTLKRRPGLSVSYDENNVLIEKTS